MTPSKKIHNLFGEDALKTYPSQEEKNNLPKLEDGSPDLRKLPPETIGNVLLILLTNYVVEDRKDTFAVHTLGSLIFNTEEGGSIELNEKLKKFLLKVLAWGTIRQQTEKEKDPRKGGVYQAWVIGQILEDLGEENEFVE